MSDVSGIPHAARQDEGVVWTAGTDTAALADAVERARKNLPTALRKGEDAEDWVHDHAEDVLRAFDAALSRAADAQQAVDRLQQAIDGAPHSDYCGTPTTWWPCRCWKAPYVVPPAARVPSSPIAHQDGGGTCCDYRDHNGQGCSCTEHVRDSEHVFGRIPRGSNGDGGAT